MFMNRKTFESKKKFLRDRLLKRREIDVKRIDLKTLKNLMLNNI